MTHLILKLNQSVAETVDATCVDDLYKLTVDNALDASSTLEGRITTAVSTVKKVNTLHTLDSNTPPQPVLTNNLTRWDGLFVTAAAYGVAFSDPVWELLCINKFGDGNSITEAQMRSITSLPDNLAVNLPNLVTIDLGLATGLTGSNWFKQSVWSNCPNVKNIIIGGVALDSIQLVQFKLIMLLLGATNLDRFVVGNCKVLGGNNISGLSVDTLAVKSCQQIGDYLTRGNTTINKLYIGNTTPPVFATAYGDNSNGYINAIYVPIGTSSAYLASSDFVKGGYGWSVETLTPKLHEYDFDVDPDGIFAELQ